jgi:hypothetical protein
VGRNASIITLVIVAAIVATHSYRVAVEERALLSTSGERYAAYMRRTKRFSAAHSENAVSDDSVDAIRVSGADWRA